jgi:hypothetical protein
MLGFCGNTNEHSGYLKREFSPNRITTKFSRNLFFISGRVCSLKKEAVSSVRTFVATHHATPVTTV